MKKYKIFNLFLILIICITSCSKKKGGNYSENIKNDPQIVTIDKFSAKPIFIDTLFNKESAVFIPLETGDESLFGDATKVFAVDSSYIFYDFQLETVLEFKKNGEFVKKIGNKGKGPLEYNEIRDVNYNKYTNTIDVMDVNRRLIKNDIASGNGVSEFKFKHENFSVDKFYPVGENAYVLYNNFRFDIQTSRDVLNRFAYLKDNTFLYESLPYPYYPEKRIYPRLGINIYTYQNKVYFYESFNSVIYNVTNKGLYSKYKIVYKAINNIENNLEKEVNRMLHTNEEDHDRVRLGNVLESKRYLFLYFTESAIGSRHAFLRYALYDKELQKCIGNSSSQFLIMDFLMGGNLKQLSDEQFMLLIPSYVILKHQEAVKKSYDYKEYTPFIKKFLNLNVKDTDNPVMLLMEMK